ELSNEAASKDQLPTPAPSREAEMPKLAVTTCPAPFAPTAFEAAWDALDRFIQQMQDAPRVHSQYHTALSAICEGAGAQLAFLYSDQTGRLLEMVGSRAQSSQWCRDVIRKLTSEVPEGGMWTRGSTPPSDSATLSLPLSAAFIAVETPQP